MPSQQYFDTLIKQGQDNLHICPDCFASGTRKRFCTNAVVLMPEKVIVCCYLGDKHEISRTEFRKKVREMKNKK